MNWLLGFTMGVLLCLTYGKVTEKEIVHQSAEVADVIQAYKQGSKDLLRLNPIDARLESTCIQIWGMKQND
jgi:hypothetical protein